MPTATLTDQSGDAITSRPGPVVAFEDVSIAFDQKVVLEKISFSVERGQTQIILGPAGTGKSVLLKLANGLLCSGLRLDPHLRRGDYDHA
jgi:phospholipid/cholesterol/gamma-HCH transport system ATP-binding protein